MMRVVTLLLILLSADVVKLYQEPSCTPNQVAEGSQASFSGSMRKTKMANGTFLWRRSTFLDEPRPVIDCNIKESPPCRKTEWMQTNCTWKLVEDGDDFYRFDFTINKVEFVWHAGRWSWRMDWETNNDMMFCFLKIYAFNDQPSCTDIGISTKGNTVSWNCFVSGFYPDIDAWFAIKRPGSDTFETVHQDIDIQKRTPIPYEKGSATCALDLPTSQLKEGIHEFQFTAAVISDGRRLTSKSSGIQTVLLEGPRFPSYFHQAIHDYKPMEDQNLEIKIPVIANPPPTNYSLKRGYDPVLSYNVSYSNSTDSSNTGTVSLKMVDLTRNDHGQYVLTIINGIGNSLDFVFSITDEVGTEDSSGTDTMIIIAMATGIGLLAGLIITAITCVLWKKAHKKQTVQKPETEMDAKVQGREAEYPAPVVDLHLESYNDDDDVLNLSEIETSIRQNQHYLDIISKAEVILGKHAINTDFEGGSGVYQEPDQEPIEFQRSKRWGMEEDEYLEPAPFDIKSQRVSRPTERSQEPHSDVIVTGTTDRRYKNIEEGSDGYLEPELELGNPAKEDYENLGCGPIDDDRKASAPRIPEQHVGRMSDKPYRNINKESEDFYVKPDGVLWQQKC